MENVKEGVLLEMFCLPGRLDVGHEALVVGYCFILFSISFYFTG